MRLLLSLLLLLAGKAWAASCPANSGALHLDVYQPRTACVSPCLLFFDTTGSPNYFQSNAKHTTNSSTLGGANNVVQDVYYTWDFGDRGASGTGPWAYGANGINAKNKATGPVAAHLYVLPINATADVNYTVHVWAYNSTNVADCTVPVTIYAPSGTNGFPTTSTYCVYNSAVGSGCPAGASTASASTLAAALTNLTSNRRVLLRCGDTFTGNGNIAATVAKASLGAYGGCEDTTTNRPILNSTSGNTLNVVGDTSGGVQDLRIADISFNDGTFTSTAMILGYQNTATYVRQITIYNVNCGNVNACTRTEWTQSGMIGSTTTANNYPNYINTGQNQCLNGNQTLNCGLGSYDAANYSGISYGAFIGNSSDDVPGGPAGSHNIRIGACRMCVISNNTVTRTPGGNSLIKFHSGNNFNSSATWVGQWTEINEVSDNQLSNGSNGGYNTAYCPQNTTYDERIRYGIWERNFHQLNNVDVTGPLICAMQTTVRNNVVAMSIATNAVFAPTYCIYATRQTAQDPTSFGSMEFYNNTCWVAAGTQTLATAAIQVDANASSFLQNNLVYNLSTARPVAQSATGNTVANNSANATTAFTPVNYSTTFGTLRDFKPTTAVTGATTAVPNYFDATGLQWGPNGMRLGAFSPAAPTH